MARDFSSVMPARVVVVYRSRRCSGLPSDTVPPFYVKNVAIDDSGWAHAGEGFTGTDGRAKRYRDYALALYDVGGANPTNQSALDTLAEQIAKDFYNWRSVAFDLVYNGIAAPDMNALLDEVEFAYDMDGCWTRMTTGPYDGESEVLLHTDPANAGCVDNLSADPPMIVTKTPCLEWYEPGAVLSGGSIYLPVFILCLQDGRLVHTYSRTEVVPCTGCSCGWKFVVLNCDGVTPLPGSVVELRQSGTLIATCTTTGQVTGVTLISGGGGYTSVATVSFSGGGGGSGAAATATMSLWSGNFARTAGGSGYTNGSYTNGTFSGGGGSGGTFNYTVSGGVVQPTLTLTNAGSGYTSNPTPVFNAGPGTGATATINLKVASVAVTAGGSGYTSNPSVNFSAGSSGAAVGNAAFSVFCRLTPPNGTYDVTITPPSGYGLTTYTASLAHTCTSDDQTTTATMTVDSSTQCQPGCPCPTVPNTLTVTALPGAPARLEYNDTLIWDSPVGGFAPNTGIWFGQTAYPDTLNGGVYYLQYIPCTLRLNWVNPAGGSGVVQIYSGATTCVPYYVVHTSQFPSADGPAITG